MMGGGIYGGAGMAAAMGDIGGGYLSGASPHRGGIYDMKPARSYDYCDESLNQLDRADLYASSSLQHSQFLLPPTLASNASVSGITFLTILII